MPYSIDLDAKDRQLRARQNQDPVVGGAVFGPGARLEAEQNGGICQESLAPLVTPHRRGHSGGDQPDVARHRVAAPVLGLDARKPDDSRPEPYAVRELGAFADDVVGRQQDAEGILAKGLLAAHARPVVGNGGAVAHLLQRLHAGEVALGMWKRELVVAGKVPQILGQIGGGVDGTVGPWLEDRLAQAIGLEAPIALHGTNVGEDQLFLDIVPPRA